MSHLQFFDCVGNVTLCLCCELCIALSVSSYSLLSGKSQKREKPTENYQRLRGSRPASEDSIRMLHLITKDAELEWIEKPHLAQ